MVTYINFCGQGNSGKTTTIDMVVKRLEKHPNAKTIEVKKCRKDSTDYRALLEITISKITYKIALSTYGDNLHELELNHKFFDDNSPDVMVTASHCHDDYEHNLFIDNYVNCRIDASNTYKSEREHFDYIKVHSKKIEGTKQEINNKNTKYAEKLYDLILASLK